MHSNHKLEKDCCFCVKVFNTHMSVINHQQCHDQLSIPCRLCQEPVVAQFEVVQRHMKKTHQINKAECCFCPMKYGEIKGLRVHILKFHVRGARRSEGDEYRGYRPCKICKLFLTRKEELTHMKFAHNRPGECSLCAFKVGNIDVNSKDDIRDLALASASSDAEDEIRRHLRIVHLRNSSRCRYCNKNFETATIAADHRKNCSSKTEAVLKANEKRLCNECGKMVVKSRMTYHRNRCSKIILSYPCPKCPLRFPRADRLQGHLVEVHFPEQKEFICGICGKAYSTSSGFKRHMLMHERPSIKCPRQSCDKVFKWKNNVMQHLRGELDANEARYIGI